MRVMIAVLAGLVACATPAYGQSSMVSASNPTGLVKVLESAGYSPKLGADSYGDPEIELEIAGYNASMVFYGCDEETKKNCDSVQLQAGFDRTEPWTATAALEVSKKFRFASIWLDDEGDPWVQWDIVTGEGIPAKVFLSSVESFGVTLEDAAALVFAE